MKYLGLAIILLLFIGCTPTDYQKVGDYYADRLDDISGDTWSSGTFGIYVTKALCTGSTCDFFVTAVEYYPDMTNDTRMAVDFKCTVDMSPYPIAKYVPDALFEEITICIDDNAYDYEYWKKNMYIYNK